jgi:hypothetical protein
MRAGAMPLQPHIVNPGAEICGGAGIASVL